MNNATTIESHNYGIYSDTRIHRLKFHQFFPVSLGRIGGKYRYSTHTMLVPVPFEVKTSILVILMY